MDDSHNSTIFAVARAHWQVFAPAWIFPIFFLYGGEAADHLGHPNLFFFVALTLSFWSFIRASKPWLKREISYKHTILLTMIVPFLVWTLVVLIHLAMSR